MKLQGLIQRIGKMTASESCAAIMVAASRRFDELNKKYHDELLDLNKTRDAVRSEQKTLSESHAAFELLLARHGIIPDGLTALEQLTKAERTAIAKARGESVCKYRNENAYKIKNKWHCTYCARVISGREMNVIVEMDYSVIVLRHGEDFMAQACSRECRISAAEMYQKEKACLQQQLTELKAMKRMVAITSQEALKLHKQELRQAKSLQAS